MNRLIVTRKRRALNLPLISVQASSTQNKRGTLGLLGVCFRSPRWRTASDTFEFLIVVLAHRRPAFVCDTLQALKHYTDPCRTLVVVAVNHASQRRPLLKAVADELGPDFVYPDDLPLGWGAGLWALLLRTIRWARTRFRFRNVVKMDYDTLVIKPGLEDALSQHVGPRVGIVADEWHVNAGVRVRRQEHTDFQWFRKALGWDLTAVDWTVGNAGALFAITPAFLSRIDEDGQMERVEEIIGHLGTYDDQYPHLLCQHYGLDIGALTDDPRFSPHWQDSVESVLSHAEKEVIAFHPTKVWPGTHDQEQERVRAFYREIRLKETYRRI